MPNVTILEPTCVPGQLGTKADYRLPVALVSDEGKFGTSGTISLTSNHNPGYPGEMTVVANSVWLEHAIAAQFPSANPGDGLAGEQFTITVHPNDGDDIVISPVIVTGPPGSGWPPTM